MARKIKTDAEKDRAKDLRLQRKYGITLAEYNARAAQQDHKCKICGGPLDAYGPPNVDHFHFFVDAFCVTDFEMRAMGMKWCARGYDERRQVICEKYANTKIQARADVKTEMMPWSVRSLLCFKCNRGLGSIEKFFNAARAPENLYPVIEYLKSRLTLK
jgi:hypothetical protein